VRIGERFRGVPLLANLVEDGKTPILGVDALKQMGYRILLRPISALLATAKRLEEVYAQILSGGDPGARVSFAQYNEIVGLPEATAFANRCRRE